MHIRCLDLAHTTAQEKKGMVTKKKRGSFCKKSIHFSHNVSGSLTYRATVHQQLCSEVMSMTSATQPKPGGAGEGQAALTPLTDEELGPRT